MREHPYDCDYKECEHYHDDTNATCGRWGCHRPLCDRAQHAAIETLRFLDAEETAESDE